MRALYFGTYERDYPRNSQVVACLRRAGVDVVEHHVSVWEGQRHKFALGIGSAMRLARAELRLLRRPTDDFDVVIVGYPGHFDMPVARRIAGQRPLVFNPLVSLYDTFVLDRGRWSPRSAQGRLLKMVDRRAVRMADLVVMDTENHADFIARLGGVSRARIEVALLGADESRFTPPWQPEKPFRCFFHGKLIPVHGLPTILEAARHVPEITFRMTGTGQLQDLLARDRPPNVDWLGWVEDDRIPAELRSAGCALGIFGTSEKASRVVPNKVFEALACGAPVITADTPGIRELLSDGESALLVPPGDPKALAGAVRRIARDPELARTLSQGGLRASREHASCEVLGARWRNILESVIDERS